MGRGLLIGAILTAMLPLAAVGLLTITTESFVHIGDKLTGLKLFVTNESEVIPSIGECAALCKVTISARWFGGGAFKWYR